MRCLSAHDAARTILQHLHVVIGFEHEHVRGADAFEHQLGDVAEVGGKTDIAGGGAQKKPTGSCASCGMEKVSTSKSSNSKRSPVSNSRQSILVLKLSALFAAGKLVFLAPIWSLNAQMAASCVPRLQ